MQETEIDSENIKASASSYHKRRICSRCILLEETTIPCTSDSLFFSQSAISHTAESTQLPATEALYEGMCMLASLNTMTEEQVAAYQDSSEIVERLKTMSIDQLKGKSRKHHRMRDISRVALDLSKMRDAHETSLSHTDEEYDESFPMIEWTDDQQSSQEGLADVHPECYCRILFPSSPAGRESSYGGLLRSKCIESQLGSLESC